MSFLLLFCTIGGSFALINVLPKFGGCLNASMGGLGKTSSIFVSFVIVVQCFLIMFDMLGSFGLNVTAKITLSLVFLSLLFRVSFLSKDQAFSIAAFGGWVKVLVHVDGFAINVITGYDKVEKKRT